MIKHNILALDASTEALSLVLHYQGQTFHHFEECPQQHSQKILPLIDELLAKLDDTDMSSPAWLRHLKTLQEKVEHHLADEEQEFFQVAGNVLNDRQKTKLADEYQKEMKQELDDEKLTA